jgi:hypothetical protein
MSSPPKYGTKLTDYDEKLASSSESSQPTDADRLHEERKLVRKLDKRILPIACLLYLFACSYTARTRLLGAQLTICIALDLDRSNLGNARLQGLDDDILGGDETGVLFDWINSVFFFSYVSLPIQACPRLTLADIPR